MTDHQKDIRTMFSPGLFWDVSQLSPKTHKHFIISRVLNDGLTEDIRLLRQMFCEDDFKEVILTRRNLNQRTAIFWCAYFKIPEKLCPSLNTSLTKTC